MTIETFLVLAKVLLKKPGFTDTKKSHFLVGRARAKRNPTFDVGFHYERPIALRDYYEQN
jgi:hypothetical protein